MYASLHLSFTHRTDLLLLKGDNLKTSYPTQTPRSHAQVYPPILPVQILFLQIRSGQISRSVVSDSLWPHESQHPRPPCPSPTSGVHPDSRPLSQWCHPTISSSVVPFSSCPQSLPASESFPMSQHFAWGGQSTGVIALTSFLPKKSQGWSPSEWTWHLIFHVRKLL